MSYTPPKTAEGRKLALRPIILALVCLGLVNYYLASNELWVGIGLFGAYSIGYWVGYFARTKDEKFKTDLNWAVTGNTAEYTTTDMDIDTFVEGAHDTNFMLSLIMS